MNNPLVYITIVLALGIVAQWVAWRFRLPSILLLLAFGFCAGQFYQPIDVVLGGSNQITESLIRDVVGLCVAIILFEGGLTLKFSELRQSGVSVLRMCTVGVVIAFVLTTAFCIFGMGLNWRLAAVLGSILVVTGPTVIAPLLRHIQPSRKIGSIVKWEGIVVDPIGAVLAVLVFSVALSDDMETAKHVALIAFGKTILVGGLIAFLLAKAIEKALKHHLIPDFLHSVFLLSIVAISFTASNLFQPEAGLLTVTVLGIALANQKSVSVKHILEFKENLRVLIISCLFIVLSGRIQASSLLEVLPMGLGLLAVLVIVVRPLSVFGANLFSRKLNFKEQVFLSMMAPRGIVAAAVTSIFAMEFIHAVKENHFSGELAEEIKTQAVILEPIVFIVIVGTVTFYGLLAAPLARRLGVSKGNPMGVLFAGASPWVRMIAKELHDDGHDVLLLDTNYSNVAAATMEGLPATRANILSEYVEEELEMNGLGMLITSTPNDEINSLATKEFSHIFGSANVWQIAPSDDDESHATSVAASLRGRICFPGRPTYSELDDFVESGARIKKTQITEQFTYQDFVERYLHTALVLFLYSTEKGLRPAVDGMKPPGPGTTIFALTIPQESDSCIDL